MSATPPDDPTTALNQVLSEVIDVVLEVRQAYRKVPETHALHAELDQLFDDVRSWARLLVEQDDARGGAQPRSRRFLNIFLHPARSGNGVHGDAHGCNGLQLTRVCGPSHSPRPLFFHYEHATNHRSDRILRE